MELKIVRNKLKSSWGLPTSWQPRTMGPVILKAMPKHRAHSDYAASVVIATDTVGFDFTGPWYEDHVLHDWV